MSSYRINIDYESQLFLNQPKPSWNSEYEYLFLIMGNRGDKLYSENTFSGEYLNYLETIFGELPGITSENDPEIKNWWGALKDLVLERKLNSKITSSELAIEHCLAHSETAIVKNLAQVKERILKSKYKSWILKRGSGSSGVGQYLFDTEKLQQMKFQNELEKLFLEEEMIFDPCLKRIMDIGVTFDLEKKTHFLIHNFNDQKGAFCGGYKLPAAMSPRYSELVNSLGPIVEAYKEIGATGHLEIDTFSYLEEGELKWYRLCEVNYRKTMGTFINHLSSFSSEAAIGGWFLFPSKKMKSFSDLEQLKSCLGTDLYNGERGVIITSPLGNHFLGLYLMAPHLKDLQFTIHQIWKKLTIKKGPLPSQFQFYF